MKKFLIVGCLIISGLPLYAQTPATVIGTIQKALPLTLNLPNSIKTQRIKVPRIAEKEISILQIELSSDMQEILKQHLYRNKDDSKEDVLDYYPRRIQLGMNGVPVLEQGLHGTCAVFAVTAALDALIGKGDYISQLCQLELNEYLYHHSYIINGWEGAWGQNIYEQINMFGIVSKSQQARGACGSVLEYPLHGENIEAELSLSEYHVLSESILDYDIGFTPLALQDQIDTIDRNHLLMQIKQSLMQGDRVTTGVILYAYDRGQIGALASHHVPYDTWITTNDINEDFYEYGSHAFVITGYDDDAIAIDAQGHHYRGLLTLRNSWGDAVGDKGDFYMSYAYFKTFVMEAHRIGRYQETGPLLE